MKKILFQLSLSIFLIINGSASSQNATIDTTRLKANLNYLASDELSGRGSATEFEFIAARFIIQNSKNMVFSLILTLLICKSLNYCQKHTKTPPV